MGEAVKANKKKIEIVQVMRGIAALGVVYFHTEYGPWQSANWGVDFFFILSGYFLMMSTENNGGGVCYWKNKLMRLCPLYYIFTLMVAVGFKMAPSVFRSTVVNGETLLKSFLFIPCYARQGMIFPIYSIGWTLNLEMFFYVLFFLAMKINHRCRGFIASGMICVLIVLGMVYKPQNAIMKFWTQQMLFEFVLGIAVYGLQARIGEFKVNQKVCIVGIGVILLLQFSYKILLEGRYHLACSMVLSTLLLLLCLPLKDMKVNHHLKQLGDMSYTLYLTHFFIVGTICRVLIDNSRISIKNTCIVVITIAMTILLSWYVHLEFEKLSRKCFQK